MEIGQNVPDWKLDSIFGDTVPNIASFQGKPLLLLFFSLGCPGCKGRAIPYANKLIVENANVSIIGIHSNFQGGEYSILDFENAKEDFYIRFPFYKDSNDTDTFKLFGAGGAPHWILIDKDGKLNYSIFGSDLNNALLRLDLKIQELQNP